MSPDPSTDPIPEGGQPQYGFFARLFGFPTNEHRMKEFFMARLDAVTTALTGARTALNDLGTQIDKLAGQIGDLQAGTVTQEEIDAVAADATSLAEGITTASAAVDAAIEVPGEDDVVPPPPPPVEPLP